jgi:MFS family permease
VPGAGTPSVTWRLGKRGAALDRQVFGIERNGQLLFLATLLNGLAEGLWRYILPVYIGDLGAEPSHVGWVLSLSSISMLIGFLPAGFLSDRVSRRGILIISRVVMGSGAALMALAHGWQAIMPGLSLFYFGWFSYPVISGYLAQVYRDRNATAAFTVVFAGYSIGLITSPAIGGKLAAEQGMPFTLGLSAILLLFSATPLFFLDPQTPRASTPLGAYRALLRHHDLRAFLVFIALLMTVFNAGQVLAPNYLRERAELGMGAIGQLGTVASAGTALFNFSLGRIQPRLALRLAMMGMVISMAILVAAPRSLLVWGAYLLIGLVGTTSFLSGGMMAPWVPEGTTGVAYGIQGVTVGLSAVLGPAAAGLLYKASPNLLFISVGLILSLFFVWTARSPLALLETPHRQARG